MNHPTGEAVEQISKLIPNLAAAAKAVGLQDHKRLLEASAKRVDDSHRLGMKQLGFDVAKDGDDMGGDIFICGDITGGDPSKVIDSLNGNQKCPTVHPTPKKGKLSSVVAVAGLLASGASIGAIPTILNYWNRTDQAAEIVEPTTNANPTNGDSMIVEIDGTKYGFQLWKPNE